MVDEQTKREVATSATFEAHLQRAPPQWLHHYTTQAGLLGIVSDGALRATKIQYMNDATELQLALDLATSRAKARLQDTNDTDAKLAELPRRLHSISRTNVFVTCFCEDGDLLSQWRGYAGANQGYSITLKAAVLLERIREAGFKIGQCIYDPAIQSKIIDELVTDSLTFNTPLDCASAFERALLSIGAFFKHQTFVDESEWRAVSDVTDIRMGTVNFRVGQSMLVPYRSVDLGAGSTSAIWGAVVGPCPHPDLSHSAIQMLFMKNALGMQPGSPWAINQPAVKKSSIPYRNW